MDSGWCHSLVVIGATKSQDHLTASVAATGALGYRMAFIKLSAAALEKSRFFGDLANNPELFNSAKDIMNKHPKIAESKKEIFTTMYRPED